MADYKITFTDKNGAIQIKHSLEKNWGSNTEQFIDSVIRVTLNEMFVNHLSVRSIVVEEM